MIRALGYCSIPFNPAKPGRLCRGRERWITPFELEERSDEITRMVISGATFSDESAADALRGLQHAGVDPAQVINAVFPRRTLVAFMEDGHPADIPEDAIGVEMYTGYRAGGLSEALRVRWFKPCSGIREVRKLIGPDLHNPAVRGFAVLDPDVDIADESVRDRFYLFTGMSHLDSPRAHYQPSALPDVLEVAKAVVVLHRDKNGIVVGVYSREPIQADGRLQTLCDKHGALRIPFAIPPMLARWDRALYEARMEWTDTHDEPFPVPAAPEGSGWEPRWKRRKRRKKRRGGGDDEE